MQMTLGNFLQRPTPAYVPINNISFTANVPAIVMPRELPPNGTMTFPTPMSNKMLNIPGQNVFELYHGPRTQYRTDGQR